MGVVDGGRVLYALKLEFPESVLVYVEVRGQIAVGGCLLPREFWGLSSGCQACEANTFTQGPNYDYFEPWIESSLHMLEIKTVYILSMAI